MLTEKDLIDGQRWLACWEKVTSKPFTSRETFFARAIESAACAERDKRIAELEEMNKHLYSLMQSGEQRGVAKGIEESKERIEELKRQLEEARLLLSVSCNHVALMELRKDADRYRWLFAGNKVREQFSKAYESWDGSNGKDGFDEAIDAAMKGTP